MIQGYAEYKDSGVEWLGGIPKSWGTAKLKFIATLYNGDSLNESQKKSYESDDTTVGYAYISSKDITAETSTIDYNNGLRIPKEHTKFKLAPKTASLICIEGGSAGRKIAFTKENVCFVNKLACVETQQSHDPKYTFYLLKSGPFQKQFYSAMTGLIGGVAISNIKNIELVSPPTPEQTAIANFLDDKTAKIDDLVQIKRRQIELLVERKQFLIQEAVTKGLNPDAKRKDSGLDWIGDIPEHWDVLRNAALFAERKDAGQEKLPVLSVSIHSGVSSKELSADENIRSAVKIEDRTAYKEVLPGYIAYNMMRAWQGGIGAVSVHGMVSPAYVVAKPTEGLDANYFELLYRTPAFIWQMDANSKGITDFRKRLYWESFRELKTILPPLSEQQDISEFIASKSDDINDAIDIKEKQISKLNEYKTTLINAAVTGKIKVA